MRRYMMSIIVVVVALLVAPAAALGQDGTFDSAGAPLYYSSAGTGTPAILLSGGPGFTVDYMVPVGDFCRPTTGESSSSSAAGVGRGLPS